MSYYVIGGRPYIFHKEAGDKSPITFPSDTMHVSVSGAQGTKIYFAAQDVQDDVKFITVGAQGFWTAPANVKQMYVVGTGVAEVVGYCITR